MICAKCKTILTAHIPNNISEHCEVDPCPVCMKNATEDGYNEALKENK